MWLVMQRILTVLPLFLSCRALRPESAAQDLTHTRTAFVVVTPAETCSEFLEEWKSWAANLSEIGVDMYVLVHGSIGRLKESLTEMPVTVMQMVSDKEVLNNFAGKWAGWTHPDLRRRLSYYMHAPFHISWHESARNADGQPYQYVWFVEEDVFFGGNVSDFVSYYMNNPADLIDAFDDFYDLSSWTDGFVFPDDVPAAKRVHKW